MQEEERMILLRKAISGRLEPVRGSMTDADFAELVNDVALNELKDRKRIMKSGVSS
jgi:hypothetical protein